MPTREPLKLDARRTADFRRELLRRARAWIPGWGAGDNPGDFAAALVEVAARLSAQVTERLDQAGTKLSLGLLDWLAVQGKAAHPARLPVAFKLTDSAQGPALALRGTQLQADAAGTSVTFETETDVLLLPGTIRTLVGIDTAADAWYLPPPGLSSLDPIEPRPDRWTLKSFVQSGDATLQVDPPLGLSAGDVIRLGDHEYRVTSMEGNLVGISPGVLDTAGLEETAELTRVATFAPFDTPAHNEQLHALYLGDKTLFDLPSAARIEVRGVSAIFSDTDTQWSFFGKAAGIDEPQWLDLTVDSAASTDPAVIALSKPSGAIEPTDVGPIKGSRFIRAQRANVPDPNDKLTSEGISVRLNPAPPASTPSTGTGTGTGSPASSPADDPGVSAVGFNNTTPLSFNSPFYPLGREPKVSDTFYLGCTDALSKPDAAVTIDFGLADASAQTFSVLREGPYANQILASVGGDGALHLYQLNTTTGALSPFGNEPPLIPTSSSGSSSLLDPRPEWRVPMWAVNDDGSTETSPFPGGLFPPFPGGFWGGLAGIFGNFLANPFYVAVAAGSTVWIRKEFPLFPQLSHWFPLPPLPTVGAAKTIDGLVYVRSAVNGKGARLYAAFGGKLFSNPGLFNDPTDPNFGAGWDEAVLSPSVGTLSLKRIAAIDDFDATRLWTGTRALVALYGGVDQLTHDPFGCVFHVHIPFPFTANDHHSIELTDRTATPPSLASLDTGPSGISTPAGTTVCWADSVQKSLLKASRLSGAPLATSASSEAPEMPDSLLGVTLATAQKDNEAIVLATASRGAQCLVLDWQPFPLSTPFPYLESALPASVGAIESSPTSAGGFVVVPGTQSAALVSRLTPADRVTFSATLSTGVATADPPNLPVTKGDLVAISDATGSFEYSSVSDLSKSNSGELFHGLQNSIGIGVSGPEVEFFRIAAPVKFAGTLTSPSTFDLDASDHATPTNVLFAFSYGTVAAQVARIASSATAGGTTTATLAAGTYSLPANGATLYYWYPEPLQARIAPYLALDPYSTGSWSADLLKDAPIQIAASPPLTEHGRAFDTAGPNSHPTLIVLDAPLDHLPALSGGQAQCLLDTSFGPWTQQLGAATSNPELQWEYFDGTTWITLSGLQDPTQDLLRTGQITFHVPRTLHATEVVGKTDYWIRARLIRGDYGRERVTVVTKTDPSDPTRTTQEVIRDTSDFHPPLVISMRIHYSVDAAVFPTSLVTLDSGSWRDQSEANRTPGPRIEAFVPLSEWIHRLDSPSSPIGATPVSPTTPPSASPSCGCNTVATPAPALPSVAAPSPAPATPSRAVLLGFDAPLQSEPVNVLLQVEPRVHDAFAPLTVEALTNRGFELLTVKDTTRALGETGLLTMSFPVKPTPRELFGSTLTWLRLRPASSASTDPWSPEIRGAYLNAVWAQATETLTREPLGSSDGRPGLTVRVARPPILQSSLELRVREPLDDEERQQLLDGSTASNPDDVAVKYDLTELPGNWVLWRQVPDPSDWGPADRVYALDEAAGEILFGDGIHGMIPPIGRDAVVAFRYQRTEPAADGGDSVPANSVEPRTKLNVVTPVEGVESAAAADHGAGGASPETNQRVLRFGTARLRHRERAVSLADFEDLTLESSPDFVQARAFREPGRVRLVVVATGATHGPSAAQVRELRRQLLAAASPLLAASGALLITGPRVRHLRIRLSLEVADLDLAGETARDARLALQKLLDPATGGSDGIGWPLGLGPADDDIAMALTDARGLVDIADIGYLEVSDTGDESAWNNAVRADDLVVLHSDPVRINFAVVEAGS